jgi:hypothetical protein
MVIGWQRPITRVMQSLISFTIGGSEGGARTHEYNVLSSLFEHVFLRLVTGLVTVPHKPVLLA